MSKTRSFLFLFVLAGGVVFYSLPHKINLNERSGASFKIKDRHGRLIRHHQDEGAYNIVRLKDLSPTLVELIVKSEDKRFYQHQGIDFIATSRALYQNIIGLRKVSGASTITQQVARLAFKYERTWVNKVLVMLTALKLEFYYTKGELLEFYVNFIPYTYKINGVVQGANYYFGRELSELSPAELATLVILIRGPSRYVSTQNQDHLIKLRNSLLDQINLKKDVLELSKKESWYFVKLRHQARSPHFARALLKKHKIKAGVVKSTLDLALQEEIQKILNEKMKKLKKLGVNSASILVLDNKDGGILSYIGNHDFFSEDGGEFDGIQIPRQPGSTMKAFTYALALESQNYSLGSVLPDTQMYFKAGLGIYKPRNYSMKFTGPRTLREALANSLNIPALYLADDLGVNRLFEFMQSFGLTFPKDADHYGVGLTLGNSEVSLMELTSAYMAFARKGNFITPRFLMNEKIIENKTLMSAQTSELITNVLNDNYARRGSFGRQSALDTKVPSAAKTGTSTLYRDNWVIGYTPRFTVGVWVGNMNQKEMRNVSGISGAGPIYQEVVNITSQYYHSPSFQLRPLKRAQICSQSGMKAHEYCARSYTESFRTGEAPTQKCTFHSLVSVRDCHEAGDNERVSILQLPSIYSEWHKEGVHEQVKDICSNEGFNIQLVSVNKEKFQILSPPTGAIYAVDPNIPTRLQKLHINTTTPTHTKEIRWFLNGKKVETTFLGEEFYWKLKKGNHKLKGELYHRDGKVSIDSIDINVL